MAYTDIKTEFVKRETRKTAWKNRDYIDHLMLLERLILGKVRGWAGNMYASQIKQRYQKQYLSIYKELNPGKREKYVKQARWGRPLREMLDML